MIWLARQTIKHVCSPDPLEEAQRLRRMKVSGEIIAQRYESIHGGALQRVRASVPTEGQSA